MAKINLDGKHPEEQGRKPERTEPSTAGTDVNKELDDLKRDVDNQSTNPFFIIIQILFFIIQLWCNYAKYRECNRSNRKTV